MQAYLDFPLGMNEKLRPGRNDPCPCGSGAKYKRCHGRNLTRTPPSRDDRNRGSSLSDVIARMEAQQAQREKQQGLGRPIISEMFQDYRIVAVGNRVFYSKQWRTFHDFLLYYLPTILGRDWGANEEAKPLDARHPLLRLHALVTQFRERRKGPPSETIHTASMTGGVAAYLHLAYNLYLLAHNATLQERLLHRLRNSDQFQGALYETYVAAAFIKAGFRLELEDEGDPTIKHCEFSAMYPKTGRKLAVEAKARQPNKLSANVVNQLHAALKKRALHDRVIFIDVNVPITSTDSDRVPWLREALDGVRRKEATLTIGGTPAPPAYLVLTNLPYEYELEVDASPLTVAAEGFKILDFKMDTAFPSLHEALTAREKHREMFNLLTSMFAHSEIPTTFDGEIPEFAFGSGAGRLLVGHRYLIPSSQGLTEPATLLNAIVVEDQNKALGVFQLDTGESVIVSCELSPEELSAYRHHPDTFFGVVQRQHRRADSPIELYDFFAEVYRGASKEQLLNLMREHPDVSSLSKRPLGELLATYCERMAESATRIALRNDRTENRHGDATTPPA